MKQAPVPPRAWPPRSDPSARDSCDRPDGVSSATLMTGGWALDAIRLGCARRNPAVAASLG